MSRIKGGGRDDVGVHEEASVIADDGAACWLMQTCAMVDRVASNGDANDVLIESR